MIKSIDKTKCKKKISNKNIKEYIAKTISPLKMNEQPLCIFNFGGPGSGKSTVSKIYIKNVLKQNIKKFCVINPDDILNKYFDNNSNCYGIDNDNPHDVINELFDISVKNKYNILYDTTGLNVKDIKPKINLLKKNNYIVNVCVCLIDISVALKRVEERRKLTGRFIDSDYFYKRYNEVPKILDHFYFNLLYKKIDEIIIYNTSGAKPKIEERYN